MASAFLVACGMWHVCAQISFAHMHIFEQGSMQIETIQAGCSMEGVPPDETPVQQMVGQRTYRA